MSNHTESQQRREYCQTCNISHTTYQNLSVSHLAVVIAQSIEARCSVKNDGVVGAVQTGNAPTTSEWSTILLSTNVWLILEVWQYILFDICQRSPRAWFLGCHTYGQVGHTWFLPWNTSRRTVLMAKCKTAVTQVCKWSYCSFVLSCQYDCYIYN